MKVIWYVLRDWKQFSDRNKKFHKYAARYNEKVYLYIDITQTYLSRPSVIKQKLDNILRKCEFADILLSIEPFSEMLTISRVYDHVSAFNY